MRKPQPTLAVEWETLAARLRELDAKAAPALLASIPRLAQTQVERVAMLRDAITVLEHEKSPVTRVKPQRRARRRS
jgi:hypothetical protein